MRTIYYKSFCDDDFGECQGFFELVNKNLVLISGWSMNDAHYRHEYMQSVFTYLGVKVKELPEGQNKAAVKLLTKAFGL